MSAPNQSKEGAEGYPSGLVRGRTTEADAELTQLQRENATEYLALMEAIHHDTQRKILYGLVDGLGEASYRDLEAITTVSRRTLRKHTQRLEDDGIVERRDVNIGMVSFPSYELRALAQHMIYCYEETR